jgi:hypothetical protein
MASGGSGGRDCLQVGQIIGVAVMAYISFRAFRHGVHGHWLIVFSCGVAMPRFLYSTHR